MLQTVVPVKCAFPSFTGTFDMSRIQLTSKNGSKFAMQCVGGIDQPATMVFHVSTASTACMLIKPATLVQKSFDEKGSEGLSRWAFSLHVSIVCRHLRPC